MLAGSRDVSFLLRFNKRYREYADPGTDIVHGAYGHRWRRHFGRDQLMELVGLFRKDLGTRRGVMGMWDPRCDLDPHNDLPCNTQIMFRVLGSKLNMTVINRSNDLIWGALGANVVHMTMLHELLASELNLGLGTYRVLTNNLHVYRNLDIFEKIWGPLIVDDRYGESEIKPLPLLQRGENLENFLVDCEEFILGKHLSYVTEWFQTVAVPMVEAWTAYKEKDWERSLLYIERIQATDWRIACQDWVLRKRSSLTSTAP